MPLLIKRSCERLQAVRNFFEKSRLGEVGRFETVARCPSIAHTSSLFAYCGPERRDFRWRPEGTGLMASFPSQ